MNNLEHFVRTISGIEEPLYITTSDDTHTIKCDEKNLYIHISGNLLEIRSYLNMDNYVHILLRLSLISQMLECNETRLKSSSSFILGFTIDELYNTLSQEEIELYLKLK